MGFREDIQKMIEDTVGQIIGYATANGAAFSDIISEVHNKVNNLGVNVTERLCEEIDEIYNGQREKHIRIRNTPTSRRLMTVLGTVSIRRRLYKDMTNGRCFYAIDELLKIPKFTRVENGLQTALVERAAKGSYGAASRHIGERLTRQTVYNLTKKHAHKAVLPKNGTSEAKKIYIEADEDHIHLQNGKSAEVRLVYVHEGREDVGSGRKQLVNARYFTSVKHDDTIWEEVSGYIYGRYNVKASEIHLSGDGAVWIKNGLFHFPKAQFHLDKFHVVRSITTACGGNYARKSQILAALEENDTVTLNKIYGQMVSKGYSKSERRRIMQSRYYLENNLDEISLDKENVCSAESHVSHVLSARMSSRPMGWSISGADRIAKLRAFMYSGGDFKTLTTERTEAPYHHTIKKVLRIFDTVGHGRYELAHGKIAGIDGKTDEISLNLRKILNF